MAPNKEASEDFKFIMTCIKHSPEKLKPNFEEVAKETGAKSANACYQRHWSILKKWGLTGKKPRPNGNATARAKSTTGKKRTVKTDETDDMDDINTEKPAKRVKKEVESSPKIQEQGEPDLQDNPPDIANFPDNEIVHTESLDSYDEPESENSSDHEKNASTSFHALLQSFCRERDTLPTKKKKRRRSSQQGDKARPQKPMIAVTTQFQSTERAASPQEQPGRAEVDGASDDGSVVASDHSEAEYDASDDPFELHFSSQESNIDHPAQRQAESEWQSHSSTIGPGICRTETFSKNTAAPGHSLRSSADLFLKRRLVKTGSKLVASFTQEEQSVADAVFSYVDVVDGCRTVANSGRLRDMVSLHAVNHVYKTRDRVLKNNARLKSLSADENLDIRDQGFARPKVLIVVPTKQACVKFVDSILKFMEPDQQENKTRFLEEYSRTDPSEWQDKPEDFRELFGGNHEEDFRIGLKFTRKTVKFFSGFYNSDIICGSPLGLMRTITAGGDGKEKSKAHDADFLSSIELLIVDHATALQMQNWQHLIYLCSQLNLLPKDAHGCDFSRVRHWYLDGQAKTFRQTIILSEYLTPEINAVASEHLHNLAGRVKFVPIYVGAMLSVANLLSFSVPQAFLRVTSPSPAADSDARFKYFITAILPPLVRDAANQKGVLLFASSYVDFVRLRNYLSTSPDAAHISFGSISEYTPVRDMMRARSHFMSGRHSLLLYSERAHHHFRYRVKGIRKVIFYSIPDNPTFWTEIVTLLDLDRGAPLSETGQHHLKDSVRALFSKWDAMKLERIVGTERFRRLVHDPAGERFVFT